MTTETEKVAAAAEATTQRIAEKHEARQRHHLLGQAHTPAGNALAAAQAVYDGALATYVAAPGDKSLKVAIDAATAVLALSRVTADLVAQRDRAHVEAS